MGVTVPVRNFCSGLENAAFSSFVLRNNAQIFRKIFFESSQRQSKKFALITSAQYCISFPFKIYMKAVLWTDTKRKRVFPLIK